MTARQFPHVPHGTRMRDRPFDGGPNPFADPEAAGEMPASRVPTGASPPFASPAGQEPQPHTPADYECMLPNRSRQVLVLGALGGALAMFSLAVAGLVLLLSNWVDGMSYCLPTSFLAWAFAIPACTMGWSDLRAMRAGAMDPRGWRATRIGFWLGCLAGILGISPTLVGIAAVLIAAFA